MASHPGKSSGPGETAAGCLMVACVVLGPAGWLLGAFLLVGMVFFPPKGCR